MLHELSGELYQPLGKFKKILSLGSSIFIEIQYIAAFAPPLKIRKVWEPLGEGIREPPTGLFPLGSVSIFPTLENLSWDLLGLNVSHLFPYCLTSFLLLFLSHFLIPCHLLLALPSLWSSPFPLMPFPLFCLCLLSKYSSS